MTGVFFSRGMTVSIPVGGLSFTTDGEIGPNVTIHVHYDVCPTWLYLARRHLADAEERKATRIIAWQSEDQDARASSLEKEFESSMQAIMSAAIAIDSFYATLRDKVAIPQQTILAWRKNGTARFKQAAEVLRQAFSLNPRGSVILRQNLKEIFRFRDMAVHPAGNTAAPVLHPELQVGVEWRFDAFRADNARAIVMQAQNTIVELVATGRPSTPEIAKYAEALGKLISGLPYLGAPR
jgi:hypothetical protein